jgi:hypothetical protein
MVGVEVNRRAGVEANGEASHLQKRQQKENQEEKRGTGNVGNRGQKKKKFVAAIKLP